MKKRRKGWMDGSDQHTSTAGWQVQGDSQWKRMKEGIKERTAEFVCEHS